MAANTAIVLRGALALAGAFIVYTGVNTAFGGMQTLGLQGQKKFMEVTSQHDFLIQDNHIRFLGGIWLGIGLLFLVSTLNLKRFQPMLNVALGLIVLGGLARFTMMRADVVFDPAIVGSLVAELVLAPLLFVWLSRAVKQEPA